VCEWGGTDRQSATTSATSGTPGAAVCRGYFRCVRRIFPTAATAAGASNNTTVASPVAIAFAVAHLRRCETKRDKLASRRRAGCRYRQGVDHRAKEVESLQVPFGGASELRRHPALGVAAVTVDKDGVWRGLSKDHVGRFGIPPR